VSVAGIFVGAPERGEQVLAPLRAMGEPLFDMSARLSFVDLQQMFDPLFPAGRLRYYWKADHLDDLSTTVVAAIDEGFERCPSPLSMVSVWALGGAMARVGSHETAAGRRDAAFMVEVLANWQEPGEDERNVAWARDVSAAVQRVVPARPNFNFPGVAEDTQPFVHAVFGRQYERLRAVKRQYDPINLFRLNQNVT
jgi:hypothetical protein